MDTIVRFRDCACPGTPHAEEGDTVSLRPFLGFIAGAEVLRVLIESSGETTYLDERLGPVYLREGPIGWNVVDDQGEVELTTQALLELPYEEAQAIVDACDDLYSERVMRPLLRRLNGSSPATPTATTSATPRSSRKVPKPSSPSSPASSGDGLVPVP